MRARLITQEVGTTRLSDPVEYETADLAVEAGERAMLQGSIQKFEVWELHSEFVRELTARRTGPTRPAPPLRLLGRSGE